MHLSLTSARTELERVQKTSDNYSKQLEQTRSELRAAQNRAADLEGQLQKTEYERDIHRPQNFKWYLNNWTTPASYGLFFALAILIFTVLVTLTNISEVQRRQTMSRWLTAELTDLREDQRNAADIDVGLEDKLETSLQRLAIALCGWCSK